MKKILLIFMGLGSFCAFAQPTIMSNIIPAAGDSIHLVRCGQTNPQDGLTGADQTWDFSDLIPHPTSPDYYFKFVDPADSPHGDRYPTSFLAATAPDTQWIYYALDGGTLELVGAVAEVQVFGTAFADYDNPETESVFPMSLGTNWTDDFNGQNVAGAFSVSFNGSVSGEADGYGTLILPTGTYENVVRSRQERTYQVQGAPTTETSTLWTYSAPNTGLWLLSIEEFSNGGEQLVYYTDSPLLISSSGEMAASGQISIYPNPVKSGHILNIDSDLEQVTEVLLTDFAGRQIKTYKGLEIRQLNIPDNLFPGTYFLWIKSGENRFSQKITVAR